MLVYGLYRYIFFCVLCVSLMCVLFTFLRYVCFYLVLFLVWGSSLFTQRVNEQELNYIKFCQLSSFSFSPIICLQRNLMWK